MGVRAGFTGSITIAIPGVASGAAQALGVRRANAEEEIDLHDTSSTISTTTEGVLQETAINGKARLTLNVEAQYDAGGAGDPPDFGGGNLYKTLGIVAAIGDTIDGDFLAKRYANSLDVDGTIDYSFSLRSNGAYTRTTD